MLIGDLLMKIYPSNLRHLFDRCELDAFRDRTVFEFCWPISNIATSRLQPLPRQRARLRATPDAFRKRLAPPRNERRRPRNRPRWSVRR